jgi:hypothetical protein
VSGFLHLAPEATDGRNEIRSDGKRDGLVMFGCERPGDERRGHLDGKDRCLPDVR